jgi:hypothetical protein
MILESAILFVLLVPFPEEILIDRIELDVFRMRVVPQHRRQACKKARAILAIGISGW